MELQEFIGDKIKGIVKLRTNNEGIFEQKNASTEDLNLYIF